MCQWVHWGFVVASPELSIHGPSLSHTQSSSHRARRMGGGGKEVGAFWATPVCLGPGIACLLPVLTVQDALPSPQQGASSDTPFDTGLENSLLHTARGGKIQIWFGLVWFLCVCF